MDVILPRPDYFWQNIPFPPRRRVLRCCKELEVQHDPLLRSKRWPLIACSKRHSKISSTPEKNLSSLMKSIKIVKGLTNFHVAENGQILTRRANNVCRLAQKELFILYFCVLHEVFTYLPWDHCRAERLLRMSPLFDRILQPAVKMKYESLFRRTKTK